jgi:hypothetical protein
MGALTAMEIAGTDLSLEQQISWHFQGNCYPPVPQFMVPIAVKAIQAVNDEEPMAPIDLPEGVEFRGSTTVPASQIVNSLRLDAWIIDVDEYLSEEYE